MLSLIEILLNTGEILSIFFKILNFIVKHFADGYTPWFGFFRIWLLCEIEQILSKNTVQKKKQEVTSSRFVKDKEVFS